MRFIQRFIWKEMRETRKCVFHWGEMDCLSFVYFRLNATQRKHTHPESETYLRKYTERKLQCVDSNISCCQTNKSVVFAMANEGDNTIKSNKAMLLSTCLYEINSFLCSWSIWMGAVSIALCFLLSSSNIPNFGCQTLQCKWNEMEWNQHWTIHGILSFYTPCSFALRDKNNTTLMAFGNANKPSPKRKHTLRTEKKNQMDLRRSDSNLDWVAEILHFLFVIRRLLWDKKNKLVILNERIWQ